MGFTKIVAASDKIKAITQGSVVPKGNAAGQAGHTPQKTRDVNTGVAYANGGKVGIRPQRG